MIALILATLTFTMLFGGILFHLSELKEKVHSDNEIRKNIIWGLYISLSVVYMFFIQHVLSYYMYGKTKSLLAILITTVVVTIVRTIRQKRSENTSNSF